MKVYMPTSEYEDEEVEELYGVTEEILEEDREIQMNTTIIGNWNTEVGDKSYGNIVGRHGQAKYDERNHIVFDFYERI